MPKLVKNVWSGRKLYGPHTDELPPVDTWAGLPDEVWDVPPAIDFAEPEPVVTQPQIDDLVAARQDPDEKARASAEQEAAATLDVEITPVPTGDPNLDELLALRDRASALGITVDRRWKAPRIRREIAAKHAADAEAQP